MTGAPGHMEGHNTHAGVAIGAAYAVKQAMQRYNIPGSVAISFGPAEEQIVSRPFRPRRAVQGMPTPPSSCISATPSPRATAC